ncbi:MAG: carboxypeptidase regulatory-like domain-containing protein, partial [Clostridia bacterium]|nr:carboxypeptidase regulatory-like domain-containing protein [Clostridia bacterium]
EAALGTTGPQTGSITGRITEYGTEYGIAGASVTISGTSLSAYTNSSGYYTINDIPVGNQEAVVSANGYNSASRNVSITANQQTTVNIALEKLATPTPTPTPPPGQGGTITGRIVNTYGSGISNAFVYCGGKSVNTNYDGYFTLNDVPAGNQLFFAGSVDCFSAIGNIEVRAGSTINIEIVLEEMGYHGAGGDNIGMLMQSIAKP